MTNDVLSRSAASASVASIGWRYLLATLAASVTVRDLNQALEVAAAAGGACGESADEHLRIDIRRDRVELVLQDSRLGAVTTLDARLAVEITNAVSDLGCDIAAPVTTEPISTEPISTADSGARPVQMLEIAIDTMDTAAIRPFWKAVLGYQDEPGQDDENSIADPAHQLPTLWFQQLDEPRTQRNRIHFDIAVAHDEADRRVQAALRSGGRLVSDARARSFWILADLDGNEICVCTWQDRD